MFSMEIQQQLIKFRYNIVWTLLFSVASYALLRLTPSLINVLAFFWPLFLSTALFLFLVLYVKTSTSHTPLHKPAEELLDYVAGQHPEPPLDAHNKSD
ncbi:hypothetical protein VNO77_43145 [Canavalia gladiata]|uniref:Uncharacterized protein n=1 Tax=Canavalia gladiata TaxID=3824 RepID=A0AAN9JUA0_CANGL